MSLSTARPWPDYGIDAPPVIRVMLLVAIGASAALLHDCSWGGVPPFRVTASQPKTA